MAWLPKGNGDGFFLTVTLYDRNQDDVTLTYELRSADFATAETDALVVLSALDAVTKDVQAAYSVGKRYVQDSIVLPIEGENQIKARVAYRLADGQGNETFALRLAYRLRNVVPLLICNIIIPVLPMFTGIVKIATGQKN